MRARGLLLLIMPWFLCSPLPAVVISEVMYHPQIDETRYEYVEIYNETVARQDIGRWQFTDGIHYTFPEGTVLQPRAYLVIARDPASIASRYGITNVVGPCTGALNNASDHIILRDPAWGIMAEVDYQDSDKWPVAADGAGHSLSKFNMRGDPMDPDNWRASPYVGGTPGRDNGFATAPPPVPVVINEVNFHTSGTQFIELYNNSDFSVNIGRFYLSNDPDNLRLFQISTNTLLGARGRMAFLRSQLGFDMNTGADRILFTSPSATVVTDARAVEAGPREMSEGRWPDGADAWYYMTPTTGTANGVVLTTSVVINEIMYHPPSELNADEYIELYNAGATTVSLAGWGFSRGISYNFPTTATIGPGEYRVIAKDSNRIISRYGLASSIVLGNFVGEINDAGEKLRLRDANMNIADELTYWDGGHWSEYADGYGSSLELIDPRQDNSKYQAWAPSDETTKLTWTNFSYSGSVNWGRGDQYEHELHLALLGSGEVLIDDIHLRAGVTDYILNGNFESGSTSWLFLGNHIRSSVVPEPGLPSNHCLKIVATGSGDPGFNHIEQTNTAAPSGQTYTISFRAKWLYGNNLLVSRCWDNQAPETNVVPIPANTGTPGTTNSVYRANLGPVFSQVKHSPVIPRASDSPIIRARIYDPDGVASAQIFYKADSDGSYASVAMHDDGTGGDTTAGDGLYAGTIPPRTAGQTVAFYLSATDGLSAANTWPTNTSRPAHYRVEASGWFSSFPTYRMVMTQAEQDELFNRPHLSNEPVNCTFIFDEKDIYYNCGVVFTGSPYGRGGSGYGAGYRGFDIAFNSDEKLHGYKEARIDRGQNSGYHDHISYDLLRKMGLPACPAEWFDVRLNARTENVHEDLIAPGKLYLNRLYRGDSNGPLFELSSRYEFTNNTDTNSNGFVRSEPTWYDWGADKDQYRWNWRVRNHDRQDDFTSMILAIQAVSRIPSTTQEAVARYIDTQQWMRVMAVRSVNSDWDFFGTGETKNAYFYWPSDTLRRWLLIPWDNELGFENANMSLWCTTLPQVYQFQQFQGNRHYFFNAIHEYMAKYFTRAFMDPWIDHYYSLVGGHASLAFKNFIDSRRSYVQGQMNPYLPPNVYCSITTPGPLSVPGLTADLTGVAPINTSWIRVRGKLYWPTWSDATHWSVTIEVLPGTNVTTLEFLDYDKVLIGTASITISSSFHYVTNVAAVTVPEGGTAQFWVRLSAPTSGTTVTAFISWVSGDSDISVQSGSALTWSPENWNLYQAVTLAAAEDADSSNGQAIIRIHTMLGPAAPDCDVPATEAENDPVFVTDLSAVTVPEGGTAQFRVKLNLQTSATVTVSVSRVSGDSDITVQSGGTLTFTTANWDTDQAVTLAAAQDADMSNGQATIRLHTISGPSVPDKDVVATESDDDGAVEFVTDIAMVWILEGGTGQFQVKLDRQPATTATVSVSRVSGDSDITVQSGANLTFTTTNWSTYQTVALAAAPDPDTFSGQAIIRVHLVSGATAPDKDVVARELEPSTAVKRWRLY